jgi:hypothetical protein
MIKPVTIFLISYSLFTSRRSGDIGGGKISKRMKKLLVLLVFTVAMKPSFSQVGGKLDSLFAKGDTTAVLDSLMKDFDTYLDSLNGHKSFFILNLGIGTGFFSFNDKNSVLLNTKKKMIFSPAIGYFHRSGFGLSATALGLFNNGLSFYQYAFSPSYDCIRKTFSTGISYTRYLTKDSLDFYSTPIQNEIFAYFSYKKLWVRPSVSFTYGWGSSEQYQKRKVERLARLLSQTDRYYVIVRNTESVKDFASTISLRKEFDWYEVFGKSDNITFTPILMLTAGTQNYGFNTSYSYDFSPVRANSLPSNKDISDNTQFAMQSASLAFRGSYLKGRFLLQSQILFDYFLQDTQDGDSRLNTVYSITAGISF